MKKELKVKKQISQKNKRIIFGAVGATALAGVSFGIVTLLTDSNSSEKEYAISNSAVTWNVVAPTGQAPTYPTPLAPSKDLQDSWDGSHGASTGFTMQSILFGEPGRDRDWVLQQGVNDFYFDGIMKMIQKRVQPHASFNGQMWTMDGGAKLIGKRETPRLIFNGMGSQMPLFNSNDYGRPEYIIGTSTKLNPATDIHFFYHIEGETVLHPFASEASFIDLDLTSWFANNQTKTPEITIYTSFYNSQISKLGSPTFKSVIPGSSTQSLNQLVNYQGQNKIFSLGTTNTEIKGIIPSGFADAFEGSNVTVDPKFNRLFLWANTVTTYSDFKKTDIPQITIDPKSTTQKITITEASDIATRNLKYEYSLDNGTTWVSKTDIMKMPETEIFGHNHEKISWRVEATEGHAIDAKSSEVIGQDVWLFDGQAIPEAWDTPLIIKSVYGNVAFPFPDFATAADFPKPSLTITSSKDYDLNISSTFGVDFTFSLDDPNKTWGSAVNNKKTITFTELQNLIATHNLPNLFDFTKNSWIGINYTATAKSATSPVKETTGKLTAPANSKAIISTADLNISSYLSDISATNSKSFVITEHVPAAFEMSYSLNNGVSWITKAELEKLNLFDISKAPWYHQYILQKISIKDANTFFEEGNLPASYAPTTGSSTYRAEAFLSGLTEHATTNKEIIRSFKMPVTKLALSDSALPTLGAGSTTGSWTISQTLPVISSSSGQRSINPAPIFEYTFEDNWNDSTKIYASNDSNQMNLLKAQNLYDFVTGKVKTLHWRLKPSQPIPVAYGKRSNSGQLWNANDWSELDKSDTSFAGFSYEQSGIVDLGQIQVTIPKTGLEAGETYSSMRPKIVGTSSAYTIDVPNISGFTYGFKTEGETSYVDATTFKTNHPDLFDTTTGKLLKVQWEVTTTDPVKISNNGLSNKASDMELALTNMAIVPHIASAGSSDAWSFVMDASHTDFIYEFTFDNDFSNADHIFKQASTDNRKGVVAADAYMNKAGQKLSDQNLYDFANGHFAELHWRVINPTASMGASTGIVTRPASINAQVSVDALIAMFPLIDSKTGLPTGASRLTPSISGYANNYALHDGEIFTTSSTIPGLDLEYRLEGENSWYNAHNFSIHTLHRDLTDFTDPLKPVIKNVYWRIVTTAVPAGGSAITITGQNTDKLVDGLSTLTPTHRIVLTESGIETNLGKAHPVNNREVTFGLKNTQEYKDKIQLYVATNADLDATTKDFHWVTVEQAMHDYQTFFSERGGQRPTRLYWKAQLKDSLKVNGVVPGFTLPEPISSTNNPLIGESWGFFSLSNLRIIVDESPTAPTISTKHTTPTTDKNDWIIEIITGSHYDFSFQWDDATDTSVWYTKADFLDQFGAVIWDKAISGHKVLWNAAIKQGYIQDPNKPVTPSGSITPQTGAREITTISAPIITWLDVQGRDTTFHYTDAYDFSSTSLATDMTFEYSITGSGNWMSLADFKSTYQNLYEQSGNLSTGRILRVFWRATSAADAYFSKALVDAKANQGEVVIDLNPTSAPRVLKVVQLDTPKWSPKDTAFSYNLMSGTAQGVASFRYQITPDPNDVNKLDAQQFHVQYPALVYEDKTDPQNPVMKIRKVYWTAIPEDGYFLTNYTAGASPIELVIVSSTNADPVVDTNGIVTFPVGWRHNLQDDAWTSPDGRVTWTNTGDIGKYEEVTSPKRINNTVYFPKDWTYDKDKDRYSSPDGTQNWVKDPATKVYVPETTLLDKSDSSSLPIWAIAAIAAGGAVLLGVGGYLIYRRIKKRKMDY